MPGLIAAAARRLELAAQGAARLLALGPPARGGRALTGDVEGAGAGSHGRGRAEHGGGHAAHRIPQRQRDRGGGGQAEQRREPDRRRVVGLGVEGAQDLLAIEDGLRHHLAAGALLQHRRDRPAQLAERAAPPVDDLGRERRTQRQLRARGVVLIAHRRGVPVGGLGAHLRLAGALLGPLQARLPIANLVAIDAEAPPLAQRSLAPLAAEALEARLQRGRRLLGARTRRRHGGELEPVQRQVAAQGVDLRRQRGGAPSSSGRVASWAWAAAWSARSVDGAARAANRRPRARSWASASRRRHRQMGERRELGAARLGASRAARP
jgi:hypothetical protein